ncbi:MAG: hypothetical protein FWG12_06065, partial [Holophagaceae bacterium]|nr:hypothetical protein [Holophagaceae bacterium]
MRHIVVSAMLKAVLLLSSFSSFAQVNRFPGQWVGDLFLVEDMMTRHAVYLVDEVNVIQEKITSVTSIDDDFPVSRELRSWKSSSGWHGGGLHTLVYPRGIREYDADGNLYRNFFFTKWQDGEWLFLGLYKSNPTSREDALAIPCNNDRFIFVSSSADMAGNTGLQRTPFARLSLNRDKKEISLHSSIDHGRDELREHMSNPEVFGLPWSSRFIITDNYATLLCYKTGLYWIFSLESASLKKSGNIFKMVTPEMIAKGGFSGAVLCAHPEKDGTILVSAQLETDIVTTPDWKAEMKELWDANNVGMPNATMTVSDWMALYRSREKKETEQSSGIDWYRIYPEDGKVEKTFPPEGAAIDRDGGKNDLWRPMPDGS